MSEEAMEIQKTSETGRKASPSKRLPLINPARAEETVFISLDDTVRNLEKILDDCKVEYGSVFIRGAVACGKTTLARYLARQFPGDYVLVENGGNEQQWKYHIILAAYGEFDVTRINTRTEGNFLSKALSKLKEDNKVVIIDEAHQLFSYQGLVDALFKLSDNTPLFLLFSAAATAERDGVSVVTPPEIGLKYMWYPPMPDAKELALSLAGAGVFLSDESVDCFLKMCGGHRQIFMRAMDWVRTEQNDIKEVWDVRMSITNLRHSLGKSLAAVGGGWDIGFRAKIKQSRAVHVNHNYSDLKNIPLIFARLVVEGGKKLPELENQERILTINGFLVPARKQTQEEFTKYNWQDDSVLYGVPNALMAEYYYDRYKDQMNLQTRLNQGMMEPKSCADLLARVLPYMTFTTVVEFPTSNIDGKPNNPLSSGGLPYEEQYSAAMASVLQKLNIIVSTPQNPNAGKVDLLVTFKDGKTCAVENIMATSSKHEEHLKRFNKGNSNYSNANLKCMVTIGIDREKVLGHLREHKHKSVDIIGLVVSQPHDSYVMYVKSAGSEATGDPIFFGCDCVAKALQTDSSGEITVVSAQELVSIDDSRLKKKMTETASGGASFGVNDTADALRQISEQDPDGLAAIVAEYKKRQAEQQLTPG